MCAIRSKVAASQVRDTVVVDIDTTLIKAYGCQEDTAYNFHYSDNGYHPIIATDTRCRDVVGFALRPGAQYCSKGSGAFLEEVLSTMGARHPQAHLFIRGDAGFAAPEVYEACEREGVGYAVRLKCNEALRALAELAAASLEAGTAGCAYGEFSYKATSWDRKRRVVCKCEIAEGEMFASTTFIVTNMACCPADVVAFYCNRGSMELIIGELKDGFLKNCVQSSDKCANEFRCLVGILAYSLLNWLRYLALPKKFIKEKAATVRSQFVKVAAKKVSSARRALFRFPTSSPFKHAFYRALENIWHLSSA